MRFLKKMVLGVVVYWLVFVVAMTVIFCVKGSVPDTLIMYALGGGVMELVITAAIKIIKPLVEKKVGLTEKKEDSAEKKEDFPEEEDSSEPEYYDEFYEDPEMWVENLEEGAKG